MVGCWTSVGHQVRQCQSCCKNQLHIQYIYHLLHSIIGFSHWLLVLPKFAEPLLLHQVWRLDEQGEPFGPIKNISDIFPGLPKVCLLPMLKKVLGRVLDVAKYDDNLYSQWISAGTWRWLYLAQWAHICIQRYTQNCHNCKIWKLKQIYENNEKLIL